MNMKEQIEELIYAKLGENIQAGAWHSQWVGSERDVARELSEEIEKTVAETLKVKDDTIHDMGLDIARLQSCHVEDSQYRIGSIFPPSS